MAKKAYVYNGNAWEDLASSVSDLSSYATTVDLDDYQLKSVAGLTLINTTTFTTSANVVVSNVFTSNYNNYLVVGNYTISSAGTFIFARVSASGTPLTANYATVSQRIRSDAGATILQTSTTGMQMGSGSNYSTAGSFTLNVNNPFASARTFFTGLQSVREEDTLNYGFNFSGQTTNTTSYDGFALAPAAGTTSGTIRIYGLRD